MKCSHTYTVNSNDTDMNGIVGAGAMLRYMQDAANWQMEEEGPSYDELWENGNSFVITRLALSLYAPLHTHETITAQSWAVASHGMIYNRCYRVLRGEDIVAEAVSAWALVNCETHRPRRVGEVPLHYSEYEMLELDLPLRMKIPQGIMMSLIGERTIQYADVDRNLHLNNTHYPDIFCSFLPTMEKRRVISFNINFLSEALLGETEKIYLGTDDDTYYFRSVRPSGTVNAEAEILLERL